MKKTSIFLLAIITLSIVHAEAITEVDDAFENVKISPELLKKLESNMEGAKPQEGIQWDYLEFAKNTDKKIIHLEE